MIQFKNCNILHKHCYKNYPSLKFPYIKSHTGSFLYGKHCIPIEKILGLFSDEGNTRKFSKNNSLTCGISQGILKSSWIFSSKNNTRISWRIFSIGIFNLRNFDIFLYGNQYGLSQEFSPETYI